MKSLRGQLLIASPHLTDPNFFRAVVLLVKHDAEGAFGLVLNRPTQNSLHEVWKLVDPDAAGEASAAPIRLGGPVAGPLVALHGCKALSEAQVLRGVHFSAHKDRLEKLVRQHRYPCLVFSGYSGWGAGQLEAELEAGGWLLLPATAEWVFHPGEDLWSLVVAQIAAAIVAPALKTPPRPPSPGLN